MPTPLMTSLYSYAQNSFQIRRFLDQDPDFWSGERWGNVALDNLKPMLDAPALKELERFIEARELEGAAEQEACFLAGLSVGLELSRLG